MAELTTTPILSVCATTSSKIKDLIIKNGQLIFVHDTGKIALDYNSKRTFYNQIVELGTERERTSLLAPITGKYYFVIETAVLWVYQSKWIQITTPPNEIVFIGTQIPELGLSKTLYVDKAREEISVWDDVTNSYTVVSDRTKSISAEDINALFNN